MDAAGMLDRRRFGARGKRRPPSVTRAWPSPTIAGAMLLPRMYVLPAMLSRLTTGGAAMGAL
jgi:hypothetical protein